MQLMMRNALGVLTLLAGCQTTAEKPVAQEGAVRTEQPAAEPAQPPAEEAPEAAPAASIIASGNFPCFAAGTLKKAGEPLTCEPSGVLLTGESVLVASDKPTVGDGLSPVFKIPLEQMHLGNTPVHLVQPLFKNTRKIEDLSPSADGKWHFATTGFDRHRPDKAAWDAFNTLLYWPAGAPDKVAVSNAETREGVTSSASLRRSIQKAMSDTDDEGPPYFKIEGLAALPDNRLIFGVRERGASFKDFSYTVTVLEVGYDVDEEGRVKLKDNMTEALRFQPNALGNFPNATGLSSLHYDATNERLLILTSYESAATHRDIGCFVWQLPLRDYPKASEPKVFRGYDGQPLVIPHKGEAISMLDEHHAIILHDDDRVTRTEAESQERPGAHPRALHEGVWSLVFLP